MKLVSSWIAALAIMFVSTAGGEPTQAPSTERSPSVVVMEVTGRVRARPSNEAPWEALKENDVLRAGTELQTGLRSSAALRVGMNATVLVDAGTTLIIPTLERMDQLLSTSVAVKKGRADIRVDHVGLQNDFRVVTPSTTIAVSGTSLAVVNGRLMGTEVTGSRSNLMAAIEARWIQRRLAYAFGQGTSSSGLPDPALEGVDRNVARQNMPGVVDDDDQRELTWFYGPLQNVIFNINHVQQALNAQSTLADIVLDGLAAIDELEINLALLQLIEIRAATAQQANIADSAAVMAQILAQQAIQLAAAAEAMLPEIECTIAKQTSIAMGAAEIAALKRDLAAEFADVANFEMTLAIKALNDTKDALYKLEDPELAQLFADAAAVAAMHAYEAAAGATYAAGDAYAASQQAALAAAGAQHAIDQYFSKVAEIDGLAASAAGQASIAASAAQTAAALNQLAQQIGATLASNPNAATLLAQIGANTNQAVQSSVEAAQARDDALAAAAQARTLGERTLFNHAAIYAAQAAHSAAEAAAFAGQAALDAAIAQHAADLAQQLVDSYGGTAKKN